MIAAGLAGATPHMISATVTAISRLVFEFKGATIKAEVYSITDEFPYYVADVIPKTMFNELLSTLLVFLSSANREIVKSTLGFIKLSVHTLPEDVIRPQLPQLVPALLGWAHDHKNHFKTKVRHIFERMIRRFGFQDIHSCSNGEEAAKVLVNIKKRKDRAKRKKALVGNDVSEEVSVAWVCISSGSLINCSQGSSKKPTTGDAFEDVLYASESELDDSDGDDGEAEVVAPTGKRKGRDFAARLRLDDEEPMDLLSGAASRITSEYTTPSASARQRIHESPL
jgi:ribosomal RNA-processing protein 12